MSNSPCPPCFYRVSTKALIYQDNKILLVKEPDGHWELPGGGLEVGESFDLGLKREIIEEIGVNVTSVSSQPIYVWSALVPNSKNELIPKLILAYKVEIDSYNFINDPRESCEINFFAPQEIQNLNLHPNIQELKKIITP